MNTHITDKLLSITTRGIGLGTCNLCYIAATAGSDIEPPVYAMYRVFLGLTEAKLGSCPYHFTEPDRSYVYKHKILLYILERPQNIAIVPAPIKRIIDSIDFITVNGTEYSPAVAAQVKDAAGRLVPRPENLLLSNLRETVLALSTADTPVEYRAAFKANCPIPGAIWDNDLLLNADEIIPDNYDLVKSLWDESWPVFMFLIRLTEKYPKMDNGPLLPKCKYGADVSKAALMTSSMEDIRARPREIGESIDQYCKRCYPLGGFLGEYYAMESMSQEEMDAGKVALLGEQPNENVLGELGQPVMNVHSLRQQMINVNGLVYGDYMTALMETNKELLSQVVPSRPEPTNVPAVAQRPAQPNVPAVGQQRPAQTNVPAVGQQRPAQTNVPAVGQQRPAQTNVPAVGQQRPAQTNVPAVGQQRPAQTNVPAVAQKPAQMIQPAAAHQRPNQNNSRARGSRKRRRN